MIGMTEHVGGGTNIADNNWLQIKTITKCGIIISGVDLRQHFW